MNRTLESMINTILFDVVLFFAVLPLLFVAGRRSPAALAVLCVVVSAHLGILFVRYVKWSSVLWPAWTEAVAIALGLTLIVAPYTTDGVVLWEVVVLDLAGLTIIWGHARKLWYGGRTDYYFEDENEDAEALPFLPLRPLSRVTVRTASV